MNNIYKTTGFSLAAAALWAFGGGDALAHHFLESEMPQTFLAGFQSGASHPVIGLDHLAFVIAVGLAAVMLSGAARLVAPLAFIAATVAGVGVHLLAIDLIAVETVIAASVLVIGGLLASGRSLGLSTWGALFAFSGIFHGYAYGEAIIGAEATPLVGYLAGFGLVQFAIAAGVTMLAARLMKAGTIDLAFARMGGATVAGVGLVFLQQAI